MWQMEVDDCCEVEYVEVCAIFEDMVLFNSEISRIYEEPNIFVAY